MYIITNIGLRDYLRTGIIWYGDFATLLIGHGIRRDMIDHPIPPGAAAGISKIYVSTNSAEELSGVLLFLS